MDDTETKNRRARLRELIASSFGNEQKALLDHILRRTGRPANQGEMSLLTKDNSGKSFGDKKAKTLTEQIGLSRRWFDLPAGSEPFDPQQQVSYRPSLPTVLPGTSTLAHQEHLQYAVAEEASGRECIALLSDFARMSSKKRQAVKKLAQNLRTGRIDDATPFFSLEEINRAIQASLFPGGVGDSQLRQEELRHTLNEIAKLLRMQKQDLLMPSEKESIQNPQEI